jgi:hypothetical protein
MKRRSSAALFVFIVLSAIAGANTAAAQQAAQDAESQPEQEQNPLYPRFRIAAGAFASFFNTNLRLDSNNIPGDGTEIDLEDDLGFDTRKFDFRAAGDLRLGRRHHITFGYFSLSRSSNAVLDEEIEFGDEIFPVDAEVEADFSTRFALLGYRFSFLAREKVQVGVGLGLTAMFTKTGIEAVGSVGDGGFVTAEERTSTTFPVANLGLNAGWAPLSRMVVRGSVGGLYVKVSSITASVGNADAFVEYFFTRGFGAGLGYAFTKLQVEESEDPQLKISYRYSGLLLYGVFALF